MCKHIWTTVNDVRVCRLCGLTMCNGKIIFDRKLPNTGSGKGRKG